MGSRREYKGWQKYKRQDRSLWFWAWFALGLLLGATIVALGVAREVVNEPLRSLQPSTFSININDNESASEKYRLLEIVDKTNDSPQSETKETSPTIDTAEEAEPLIMIKVYLSEQQTVKEYPLEQYIQGVLSAEMPENFDSAALEAQAIAARTYIVKRLLHEQRDGIPIGVEADVTDTVRHQVFREPQEAQKAYEQAVKVTKGQVLLFQGDPIEALFFSTSSGRTENSEDYWGTAHPYLRSVSSPWDKQISPYSTSDKSFTFSELAQLLGLQESQVKKLRIESYTDGGNVDHVRAGESSFSGKQVREKLGLASAAFSLETNGKDKEVSFSVSGYGHGVGMSQWGAQGMALEGYSATDILTHYYTGAIIGDVSSVLIR